MHSSLLESLYHWKLKLQLRFLCPWQNFHLQVHRKLYQEAMDKTRMRTLAPLNLHSGALATNWAIWPPAVKPIWPLQNIHENVRQVRRSNLSDCCKIWLI
jgi:hypothetical protein